MLETFMSFAAYFIKSRRLKGPQVVVSEQWSWLVKQTFSAYVDSDDRDKINKMN